MKPIRTPNPYFESDVNSWVISEDPLALVDCGIDSPEAMDRIEKGLRRRGLALEELQFLFLTHKHPDHTGLAWKIRDRTEARVLIHEGDWSDLAQLEERRAVWADRLASRLRGWGVPAPQVREVEIQFEKAAALAQPVDAEKLRDGDRIPVGDKVVEVVHTPGHTGGSACFRVDGSLMAGDHILGDYTPNVGAGELDDTGLLGRFLASMERVEQIVLADGVAVRPGHGETLEDPVGRIGAIVDHHQAREQRILTLMADRKARDPWEIALSLFGNLRDIHVFLGVEEVNAHLELMDEKGMIDTDGKRAVLKPDVVGEKEQGLTQRR